MQNNTYTVTQVNHYIAGMFSDDLLLKGLKVKGEVGTCTYTGSGHIYFSIKDKDAQIGCVMWASRRTSGLKFKLETGMQVVVTGSVEVYERDGRYQIIATKIEEDGVGNIFEQFEALKAKLKEQGMFDEEYKRPIPKYIKTLGVVTAATGAAVRDIIDISKRRNPGIQIILYPATVQGKEAAPTIIAGINALDEYGVDCIIVGRGGGSMEDLWCFNDEALAHTIFNCGVPVISAVGHETDFTIADFVADLRAPTPSAAAELAVMDVSVDLKRIGDYKGRMEVAARKKVSLYRTYLDKYRATLKGLSPEAKINERRNRLASIEEKLNVRMDRILVNYKNRLSLTAQSLHALSPLNKLGGGYVYAVMENNRALKTVADVSNGDRISLNLKDGRVDTVVTDIAASSKDLGQ